VLDKNKNDKIYINLTDFLYILFGGYLEIIKVEDVHKTYKLGEIEVSALRGINLRVEKGEIVMILGPSGSGKSTLLNILGALDHPTSGEVYIKNQEIDQMDDYSLSMFRRYYLGFVFQSFNLIPTLDILENVLIPTIPDGHDGKIKERAMRIIDEVGLKHRINHKPNELSGGERQRVSIARALINNPEIVYADEPTGNLDSVTSKSIIDLILRLRDEENKTFVIVTHNPDLIEHADNVYHIKDGIISDWDCKKCKTEKEKKAQKDKMLISSGLRKK